MHTYSLKAPKSCAICSSDIADSDAGRWRLPPLVLPLVAARDRLVPSVLRALIAPAFAGEYDSFDAASGAADAGLDSRAAAGRPPDRAADDGSAGDEIEDGCGDGRVAARPSGVPRAWLLV